MNMRILVTYASKYGSTKEIAEKIAGVMRQDGMQVDVLPMPTVGELGPYGAVILGSAVYVGKWLKSACEFVKAQESALTERPVWIFSSGPTGEGDAVALLEGWRLPSDLQPIVERIRPRDVEVFHGNIDAGQVNWVERTAVKTLKKPFGDFRNWDAIASWAMSISRSLKSGDLPSAE